MGFGRHIHGGSPLVVAEFRLEMSLANSGILSPDYEAPRFWKPGSRCWRGLDHRLSAAAHVPELDCDGYSPAESGRSRRVPLRRQECSIPRLLEVGSRCAGTVSESCPDQAEWPATFHASASSNAIRPDWRTPEAALEFRPASWINSARARGTTFQNSGSRGLRLSTTKYDGLPGLDIRSTLRAQHFADHRQRRSLTAPRLPRPAPPENGFHSPARTLTAKKGGPRMLP